MSYRASVRFIVITTLLVWATAVELPAAAGSLVTVDHERRYTRAEVDRYADRLFNQQSTPSARYDVDVFRMELYSTDLEGEDTVVTTQLFVPRLGSVGATRRGPLYVFAAGTTGLTDACRTSREYEAGVNWGLYRHHMLAHAGQGSIGVLPDYMHFGDPDRLQPYFIAEAGGRILLDSIRAVLAYLDSPASEVRIRPAGTFLAGFSQGGHAAFAAADIRDDYAPEVELSGIIGYGPTTSIEDVFREFSVVAPAIIYTYAEHYGRDRFDPAEMLADRWLDSLERDVTRQCILGYQSYYPWGPHTLFRPEFTSALVNRRLESEYPEIYAVLAEQQTGLTGHGVPAFILQGTNDVVIDEGDQTRFVTALRERGSNVRYRLFQNSPHDTRQIGFFEVVNWMREQAQRN